MQMQSVWKENFKSFPALNEDTQVETLVIGGGIAGFMTAFRLSEAGMPVTLIEADRLFSGTSGKTTGKISVNQQTVYYDLFVKYGKKVAEKYYLSQTKAQSEYIALIKKYAIKCDLAKADSYVFAYGDGAILKSDYKLLNGFGADCEWMDSLPALNADYALKMHGEYIFDVLKFASSLPVNFTVYEHTRAIEVDCTLKTVITENAKIKAKNIIICTHYPIINRHGGYILKLRQSQSYLLATDKFLVKDMYIDERAEGLTIRPYAGGTIIGGGDHRTGRSFSDKFDDVIKRAQNFFDTANINNYWCAEDVMTADGMPMAGKYWKNADGIYVITGFNKWGMTNSLICADVICDAIVGRSNEYAELFSPARRIKGALKNNLTNAFTTAADVTKAYLGITFKGVDDIPEETGRVVFYRGKRRAVYKEKDGTLHVIGNKCPHLHGELKWNESSHCWECPCHGSRFDIYGNIISEPSTKSCKYFKSHNKS